MRKTHRDLMRVSLLAWGVVGCGSDERLTQNDAAAEPRRADLRIERPPDTAWRARCALPHGPVLRFATVDAYRDNLIGRWGLCSGEGLRMPGKPDDGGVELLADGTWRVLRLDAGDVLTPVFGVENEGTWGVYGGDQYGMAVNQARGGGVIWSPGFERDPIRMLGRFSDMLHETDVHYVRLDD